MSKLAIALCLVALAAGCAARETTLVVQVRTDLSPGRDFAEVRVTPGFASPIHTAAGAGREWGSGVRVAELPGLAVDSASLEVAALDAAGEVVVARPVRVALEGGVRVVTVLLTRDCSGVVCPGAADLPEATACLAGRCVPDDCVVERGDACGPAECERDAECPGGSACASARCVGGACFLSPDHAACPIDEVCDVAAACVPASPAGALSPRGPGHALITVTWGAEARSLRVELSSGRIEDLTAHVSAGLGRSGPTFDSNAFASPNGRWVAMIDADFGLIRVDLDGIEPPQYVLRDTVFTEQQGVAISDDGRRILFVKSVATGWGIVEATAEAGDFTTDLTDLAAASPHEFNSQPRRRGAEIVFSCSDMTFFGAGVCAVPAEGGAVEVLRAPPVEDRVYVSGPAVEASGDLLLSETDPDGLNGRIYRLPVAGGEASLVSAAIEYVYDPCALPDGRWLAMRRHPSFVLVVARDDAPEREISLEDVLPPGITNAELSDCSP